MMQTELMSSLGNTYLVVLCVCFRGKRKGRISQTPWGVPTKGYRTRHNVRTDSFIKISRHSSQQR